MVELLTFVLAIGVFCVLYAGYVGGVEDVAKPYVPGWLHLRIDIWI